MATTTTATYQPKLWTPGDWNAFFGFGTNILVNMLVLTGLLRFVLKMPDALVFGRILPALGLMMCLSTFYYAWLAYRLAQETGRDDVCALPSGVSVPHMFVVTFVIMLPITLKTGDPLKGWSAGLVWVFFQSFILMIGGFIAPYIRKITPRAALLGALAGISITFISMRPALEMFMTPAIGLLCFAIILVSWFGGYKVSEGHSGRPRRHRGRHADRVGLDPVRLQLRRNERSKPCGGVRQLRLLGAAAGVRHGVLGLRVPRHYSGHRHSVRHLRSRRGDGQRRERRGRGRCLSDHARAHRRRRGQPDRLPDGQPIHQCGLHRPPGLEGDGWPHRLFGR